MKSLKNFPGATRLAIDILNEDGPLTLQSFSGWFASDHRRESSVFELQCLSAMEEDGLVERIKGEDGHVRFHLTNKAVELMDNGKI